MDRRNFIKSTSAISGVYLVSDPMRSIINLTQDNTTWYNRPMRWAQLTLVENDPGNFDPDFWLDYFNVFMPMVQL